MRDRFEILMAKLSVLIRAAPVWLATATLVVTVLAEELISLLPESAGVQVAAWVAIALAVLAAAGRVVARLTPVPKSERGILPK